MIFECAQNVQILPNYIFSTEAFALCVVDVRMLFSSHHIVGGSLKLALSNKARTRSSQRRRSFLCVLVPAPGRQIRVGDE